MTKFTTPIGRIHLVVIPTQDQARSVAFYERLGFTVVSDVGPFGQHRWIELFPPDGTVGIALGGQGDGPGVKTGLLLTTQDLPGLHAEMQAAGIDVDDGIAQEGSGRQVTLGSETVTDPYPPMFHFRDPDGNELLMIQQSDPFPR